MDRDCTIKSKGTMKVRFGCTSLNSVLCIFYVSLSLIALCSARGLYNDDSNHCGIHQDSTRTEHDTHHRAKRSVAEDEAIIAAQPKIIELSIVCDKKCYDRWEANFRGQNPEDWFYKAVQIASLKLSPLRTRVVLSQLEIWSEFDLIPITTDASDVLMDIIDDYRNNVLVPRQWTDATVLVTGQDIQDTSSGGGGEISGLFVLGGICSEAAYGLLKFGTSQGREFFAQFLVHELGHGLGASHDHSGCDCGASSYANCCMAPSVNNYQISYYKWSDCSKAGIAAAIKLPHYECLLDKPKLYIPDGSSLCGNGIVDDGEDCDCGGGDIDNCDDFCSDSCAFKGSGTQCEPSMECCQSTGRFKASSNMCRAGRDSCDTAEYCTGLSAVCPDDVYTADGVECTDSGGEDSYCYDGSCRTRNNQCKQYWNDNYSSANDVCWQFSTPYGSISANCGESGRLPTSDYTTCSSTGDPYYMCGKLQCKGPSSDYPFPYDHSVVSWYRVPKQNSRISSDACRYLLHFLWEDQKGDSVYTEDGTKCGDGKVCFNFNCVDKSEFTNEAPDAAICGNGIIEADEDCDCGAAVADCGCCDLCSFVVQDGACLHNECGRCTGSDAACTAGAADLSPCDSDRGQCYRGECASPTRACQEYFHDTEVTVNTQAMSYHGQETIFNAYPYQWNGGGYLLKDSNNQWAELTNMGHYSMAEDPGCGMLMCSTTKVAQLYDGFTSASVSTTTFTLEPQSNFPDTRFIYYRSESIRNRTDDYYKYLPIMVPHGSPCLNDGQPGYCSTRYIQLDPNDWAWYMRAKCVSPD